jgi:hypothetical protein
MKQLCTAGALLLLLLLCTGGGTFAQVLVGEQLLSESAHTGLLNELLTAYLCTHSADGMLLAYAANQTS